VFPKTLPWRRIVEIVERKKMNKLEKIIHREAELQRRFIKWCVLKVDGVRLLIALAQDYLNNQGDEGEKYE